MNTNLQIVLPSITDTNKGVYSTSIRITEVGDTIHIAYVDITKEAEDKRKQERVEKTELNRKTVDELIAVSIVKDVKTIKISVIEDTIRLSKRYHNANGQSVVFSKSCDIDSVNIVDWVNNFITLCPLSWGSYVHSNSKEFTEANGTEYNLLTEDKKKELQTKGWSIREESRTPYEEMEDEQLWSTFPEEDDELLSDTVESIIPPYVPKMNRLHRLLSYLKLIKNN